MNAVVEQHNIAVPWKQPVSFGSSAAVNNHEFLLGLSAFIDWVSQ